MQTQTAYGIPREGPQITIVDMEDIADAEYEDNPVIDGLLDERESLLVCGPSGIGKSIFVNYITLLMANPSPTKLWDLFHIPKPLKSVIIQSENGIKSIHRRLNKIFRVNADFRKGAAYVFIPRIRGDCRMTGNLTETDFQQQVIEILKAAQADVLVLDPLISFHGGNENDNAEMRRSLDCLTYICDMADVCCIVIHHVGKGNTKNDVFSGRGASAIGDWAANILIFERSEQGGIIKVTHQKARNFNTIKPFYIQRTPDLQLLRIANPETKQDQYVKCVIEILGDMPGRKVNTQTELIEMVQARLNCKRSTAQTAINKARDMKKIIVIPGGKKGNATGYRLPDEN
ncbi:MAG: AAA family ATPase [Pseudomonadota bacterium]